MNEQEFLIFFANLFDEEVAGLEMDTEFRYLDEWTSMAGLGFITDLKEKYGIIVSVQEFKNAETIGDLYILYLSKK